MHRQKGTPNTPQAVINEIVKRPRNGETLRSLAAEYDNPLKQ